MLKIHCQNDKRKKIIMFTFYTNRWVLRYILLRKCYVGKRVLSTKDYRDVYDVSIIGGGIIGAAVARDISNKSKTLKSILIEKESDLGMHQSSHNSGVIHSGVYYRPDSLKGKFSEKGVDLILKYCDENQVPYNICGKLVVATHSCKLEDLRILHDRGVANKVEGLEMLWTKEKIKEVEPNCNGIQALWCPKVGNIDWAVVTDNFGRDYQNNGGHILLNSEVDAIAASDQADYPILIKTKKNRIFKSKYAILCGGLQSEVLSHLVDDKSKNDSTYISLRVDYQLLNTDSIRTNIYGVPDLQIPFLGVHITPTLNCGLLLGPNAVPAYSIEGYRDNVVDTTYLKNTVTSVGFQNMIRKYFQQCFNQVKKAVCPEFQIKELQALADLNANHIKKGPAAVLGQLISRDGNFVDDFRIDFFEGNGIGSKVINCKFLPSPGATCSLVIAEYVTEKLLQRCQT